MQIQSNNLYTDAELSLIKNTFADAPELFKLMRKMFLPSQIDTTADFPSFLDDLSLNEDFDLSKSGQMQLSMINMAARMKSIKFVEGKLLQLFVLAGTKQETIAETKKRLEKDSTR